MSISQYKSVGLQSDIHSASPHRLIQMLYEAALSKLAEAKGAIERKEYDHKSAMISKAIGILLELNRALDDEKGGELAENLGSLYDFMRRELMQANIDNSAEKIDSVYAMLVDLKEAWDQIPVELRDKGNAS